MSFSQTVKDALSDSVQMVVENKDSFVFRPGLDFSRNKKMDLSNLIHFILAMEGNSLEKELLDFSCNTGAASITKSAFVQNRAKLKWEAFSFLFHNFTNRFPYQKCWNGYRLIAIDCSEIYIPYNPSDSDTYIYNGENKNGWNRVHLNALYDVLNRVYIDAVVTPARHSDERGALLAMMDNHYYPDSTIIIADRGYPSFNLLAELQLRNQKYVLRFVDPSYPASILYNVTLPQEEAFDVDLKLHITKYKRPRKACPPGEKKLIRSCCKMPFLTKETPFFSYDLRVIKIKLGENNYEFLLTNLSRESFCAEDISEIYRLRWGVETAFRELKYTLGTLSFHSKKVAFIKQEIFARLILYNFCEIITGQIVLQKQSARKYDYQVNFTMAIRICKLFFQMRNKTPPNPETLIGKYILPVRKNRRFARKTKRRNPMSFLYRIA